jgi:glycosyltransferase involved in cell wall biosynthesis
VTSPVVRVAHVGPDPGGKGGMAAVMRDLLATPPPGPWELDVIVTWRGFRPAEKILPFLRGLGELAHWCRGPGQRLVHVHSTARGSLYRKSACVVLARALRRPVIIQIHSGPGDIERFAAKLGPLRRWAFGAALKTASRRLAVSTGSAQTMESCFGIDDIGVIPNAAPTVPEEEITDPAASPGVLYLGGFENHVKGGRLLLDALAGLVDELPDASFALAGPGEPPPQLAEMERRHPNVSWIGWLDQASKRQALASHSVFVLPSHSEGLPVALLEAMAWGRAIVATRVGGVPDVVEDGRDAITVPAGDPAALAGAMRSLLADPARRRQLGAGARARAVALNEDAVAGRLADLYRELVE